MLEECPIVLTSREQAAEIENQLKCKASKDPKWREKELKALLGDSEDSASDDEEEVKKDEDTFSD